MTNDDVTTKIMVLDSQDSTADSSSGSANSITTYLETIANTKTIRGFSVTPSGSSKMTVVIVHDS